MGTITTKGYAERRVLADTEEFNISFRNKDLRNSGAIQSSLEQCELFLQELVKLGLDIKDIHLQSDNINESYGGDRTLKEMQRSISFKVKYDAKFKNTLLDIISRNEFNAYISSNQYLSSSEKIKEELLQEAMANSKKRAEAIALTTGQKVKYIDSVKDHDSRTLEESFDNSKAVRGLAKFALSDQLSASEILVSEEVTVTWQID